MKPTTIPELMARAAFRKNSLIYFCALLFLRFPLLIAAGFVRSGLGDLLFLIYTIGTYFFTAMLIWSERDRLRDYHIDTLTLAIFILAKPFQVVLGATHIIRWFQVNLQVLVMTMVSIGLLLAWVRRKSPLPGFDRKTLLWLVVGILVGSAAAVVFGSILRITNPIDKSPQSLLDVLGSVMIQLTNAAVYEEPLFRCFLWGYLSRAGWKDGWILAFQAFAFSIGHIYYVQGFLFSLFVIVPVCGLLFGWIAWRSRSASASMVMHGCVNGLAGVIQALP